MGGLVSPNFHTVQIENKNFGNSIGDGINSNQGYDRPAP